MELGVLFTFFVCGSVLAREDEVGVGRGGLEEVVDSSDHFVFVGGGEVAYWGLIEEVGRQDCFVDGREGCVSCL